MSLIGLVIVVLAAFAVPAPAADAVTVHCGQVLTASTRVANDLTDCPGSGLVICAGGITVDLNGHTIDGVGFGSGTGIDNGGGHAGVHVKKGTVREFVFGIRMSGTNDVVTRVVVGSTLEDGISSSARPAARSSAARCRAPTRAAASSSRRPTGCWSKTARAPRLRKPGSSF